jgi:hypothetical protein
LGAQSFEQGINIGAKGMSPSAANAMYGGGMAAAASNYAADKYNPFATALIQGSQNPQLMNLFSGKSSVPGWDDYMKTVKNPSRGKSSVPGWDDYVASGYY